MTGYKIPKGFVEGYRNAIERYPKDSQYAWGMNAVVEALEVHPLEELDETPWHTGTPTNLDCKYLCKIKGDEETYVVMTWNGVWWRVCATTTLISEEYVVKWQKIEEGEELDG